MAVAVCAAMTCAPSLQLHVKSHFDSLIPQVEDCHHLEIHAVAKVKKAKHFIEAPRVVCTMCPVEETEYITNLRDCM